MYQKCFMILFLGILLQGYVSGQCPGNSSGIEVRCSTCGGGYFCSDDPEPIAALTCDVGEGCSEVDGNCVATDNLDSEHCGCRDGTGSILEGSFADPFNDTYYVTCDASGVPTYSQCSNGYFDPGEGNCVELPDCPTGFIGDIGIGTACTDFLKCSLTDDPESFKCNTGQIFDFNDQSCIDESVCAGSTDVELANPYKCNIFHACVSAGENIHCCPLGQNYDQTIGECVEASQSPCDRLFLNTCKDEEYENKYCKYCQTMNEGDTYSTYLGSECQTKYFECVAGDDGLEAALRTCDDGKVFASDTGNCEFLEAHPQCSAKAT